MSTYFPSTHAARWRRQWYDLTSQPAWRPGVATALVWLALVLGEFLGLTRPLLDGVQRGFLPAEKIVAQTALQTKIFIWQVGEAWQAEQALVEVRKNQAELLAQVTKLQAVEAENQSLHKMLENTDRKLTPTIITAPIISFAQPAIAVGSSAGVKAGMMVLANEQLLGFVTQVDTNQASVALLSQGITQPVLAQTDGGVTGLVQGDGHQLWLKEVPPDVTVKVGEKVSAVGQAGVTPRLFIGTVSKVENPPAAATQLIWLQQPSNFFEVGVIELR